MNVNLKKGLKALLITVRFYIISLVGMKRELIKLYASISQLAIAVLI